MPDVYLCMDGVPIWSELKIIKNGKVSVSKSQIAWHLGHTRCNGVSFFLLHCPSTGDVFLFDGGLAAKLQGSRIDDLRSAPSALRTCALARWNCDLQPAGGAARS